MKRVFLAVCVCCACGGDDAAPPVVEITPGDVSLAPRERVQLGAAVTGGSGTVVWSSSDEAVATVSAGRVEAVAAGNATVRAALAGTTASDEVVVTVRPGPEARWGHALAYDAARREVVLVGGSRGDVFLGDTWSWDGAAWRRAEAPGPPPRDQHVLVYDAARARLVLFGGRGAPGQLLTDTWEWDGATWERRATAGPPGREHHGGGWDAARGRVVVHGGQLGDDTLTDTWTWDGAAWTQVTTEVPAAGRMIPSRGATFSTTRGALLIAVGDLPDASELWSWDGAAWSLVPGGRVAAEPPLLLADGGAPGEALAVDESAPQTWRWDGAAWSRVTAASPPPRFIGAVAWDAARGEAVLFGGAVAEQAVSRYRGDTWTWNGTAWTERR